MSDAPVELGIGILSNPKAIKVVPEQYGIMMVDSYPENPQPGDDTKIAFSIVAESVSDQGSATVVLVSGFPSQIEAETLAMQIRSAITNHGEIDEIPDRLLMP